MLSLTALSVCVLVLIAIPAGSTCTVSGNGTFTTRNSFVITGVLNLTAGVRLPEIYSPVGPFTIIVSGGGNIPVTLGGNAQGVIRVTDAAANVVVNITSPLGGNWEIDASPLTYDRKLLSPLVDRW